MKYELQKITRLSGHRASIYSVLVVEDKETLLDKFIKENSKNYPSEVKDILQRMRTIGQKTGAREIFFKPGEGKGGDGICALYDNPDKKLRLYCIRNGNVNVILGGGGEKPRTMRSFQESPKLTNENYFLRAVSQLIYQRIKEKDIRYSQNGMDLEGELTFEDNDLQY